MYIILIYDVSTDIVSSVLKICREYLNRIQNSVFEGNITESNLRELKMRLSKIIDSERDSIIFFKLKSEKELNKEILGIEKEKITNIF